MAGFLVLGGCDSETGRAGEGGGGDGGGGVGGIGGVGGEEHGGGGSGGSVESGHTGTILLNPKVGGERRFVFDKEIDGCSIIENEPGCFGGTYWILSAVGTEVGGREIGVDFNWCGPSDSSEPAGILHVDLGIGGTKSLFAYLDGTEPVEQRGTAIKFSAPYDDDDAEDVGTLHFEADCDRGGISLP